MLFLEPPRKLKFRVFWDVMPCSLVENNPENTGSRQQFSRRRCYCSELDKLDGCEDSVRIHSPVLLPKKETAQCVCILTRCFTK
jgi:hypothetical protein